MCPAVSPEAEYWFESNPCYVGHYGRLPLKDLADLVGVQEVSGYHLVSVLAF